MDRPNTLRMSYFLHDYPEAKLHTITNVLENTFCISLGEDAPTFDDITIFGDFDSFTKLRDSIDACIKEAKNKLLDSKRRQCQYRYNLAK